MERIHRLLVISGKNVRHDCDCPVDGVFNPASFTQRRPGQYKIRYVPMIARMADADTNSREVAATESGYDIAKTVVAAMAAACFEPRHARFEIDFIVDDQNLFRRDSVK